MELQRAADSNNMKGSYNGLKEVWGSKKEGPVQLKSTDGMETFSDSKRVVARWSEHFQTLPSVPGDIDHEALDTIQQRITTFHKHYQVSQAWNDASIVTVYKKGDENRLWKLQRNLSSFHSRQDLRQDPSQQTIYPHNTRGSSGDTMWLQR